MTRWTSRRQEPSVQATRERVAADVDDGPVAARGKRLDVAAGHRRAGMGGALQTGHPTSHPHAGDGLRRCLASLQVRASAPGRIRTYATASGGRSIT